MRVGIYAGPSFPGSDALPAATALEYATRLAVAAQENGLDGVFVGQHYLVGPEIQIFQPLVILPYLIAHCPQLYVGTCIYLLPLHNPVDVAEQVAAIDVMTNGRFLFGIGQGYLAAEFQAFGIEPATRTARLTENIRALRTLWRDDEASFDGRFYRFEKVRLSVRPLRREGPPLMLAADTVRSATHVPARGCDLWLVSPRHSRAFLNEAVPAFRASLTAHCLPFRGLPMARDLWIADSKQEAAAQIAPYFEGYYRQYVRWGQPGERYDVDLHELLRDRVIYGTAEEVAEEIIDYHKDFGVGFMWFRVYWPGMPIDRSLDVVRALGAVVLPKVRRAVATVDPW